MVFDLTLNNLGYKNFGEVKTLHWADNTGSNLDPNKFIYVTGNNVSWDSFSSVFRYAVLCKENGNLVCCIDFENSNTIDKAQLSIEWSVSGIFRFNLE